ncbi:MAG: Hint domain-containing protein [Steroidobacteraceae bacterium]
MADVTLYSYNATGTGPDYTVTSVNEIGPESVVVQDLSTGDEFVVNGQIYQYVGGADSGGKEVGFFAENMTTGAVSFYSPTPITLGMTDHLVLNTSQGDWTCFMAGTHIATPGGSVNVEDLAIGDLVLTAEGKLAPIKWVGRQTVSTIFANPNRALPIRIRAGAIDEAVPVRDLLVSPCHAIFVDGVLVQAGALVNGNTIVRETDVPTIFVYYHIELDDHSLILAEGVPAETFVDNVDRLVFDNWDEHLQLYPDGGTIKELPYPRAASARQVPSSIVRRLASRACVLAGPLRAAS